MLKSKVLSILDYSEGNKGLKPTNSDLRALCKDWIKKDDAVHSLNEKLKKLRK